MPIIIETAESGSVTFGAQGGSQDLVMFFDGYDSEATVYGLALGLTGPLLNGFIKNGIKIDPQGGRAWRVTITYGTLGMGGGNYPLGGPAGDGAPVTPPTGDPGGGNATSSTVLTQGFRFSTTFNSQKFTQSLQTVSVTVAGNATIDPNVFPVPAPGHNFRKAIGVGQDGKVEGCDVPGTPTTVFERTVARAVVSIGYRDTVDNLIGCTNNAPFYEYAIGEALYLGCDAEYQQDSGWSLTHKFGREKNKSDIEVSPEITVAAKKGWDYLWVAYREVIGPNGLITTVPLQANVERVFESGDFGALEIGQ